jgi:serine/threonine-protein kinase HipA
MARTLDVYLHSELTGHLTQDDGGQMSFVYEESWINKPTSIPLQE